MDIMVVKFGIYDFFSGPKIIPFTLSLFRIVGSIEIDKMLSKLYPTNTYEQYKAFVHTNIMIHQKLPQKKNHKDYETFERHHELDH